MTGVDTSTLPVNKSGSDGKRTKRRSRRANAPANTAACLRSTDMTLSGNIPSAVHSRTRSTGPVKLAWETVRVCRLVQLSLFHINRPAKTLRLFRPQCTDHRICLQLLSIIILPSQITILNCSMWPCLYVLFRLRLFCRLVYRRLKTH